MDYQTIYDIADESLGTDVWFFLVLALLMAATCIALLKSDRFRERFGLFAAFGLLLLTLVAPNFFLSSCSARRSVMAEIAHGDTKVVVGKIQDFRPDRAGRGDAAIERFRIGEVEFAYRNSPTQPGFKQTRPYGGPLREGQDVRVTYLDAPDRRVITKIEIKPE